MAVIASTQPSSQSFGHRVSNSRALAAAFFSRNAWSMSRLTGSASTRRPHSTGVRESRGRAAGGFCASGSTASTYSFRLPIRKRFVHAEPGGAVGKAVCAIRGSPRDGVECGGCVDCHPNSCHSNSQTPLRHLFRRCPELLVRALEVFDRPFRKAPDARRYFVDYIVIVGH